MTDPVAIVANDHQTRHPAKINTRRLWNLSAKIEMITPVQVKTKLKTGPDTIYFVIKILILS